MSLTLPEVKEKLLHLYDPDDLVDFLEIPAEEILDRFEDRLINNLYKFEEELNDDSEREDETP